jgi:hypothetical protein
MVDKMDKTEQLTGILANELMTGAADYLQSKGLTYGKAQYEQYIDPIMVELKAVAIDAMKTALADAKDAFDAHMDQIAIQTAMATMRLAGINAAKKVVG